MKKIINDPADVVSEALTGMALAHADLIQVHRDPDFITRRGGPVQGKVAVLSGGGVQLGVDELSVPPNRVPEIKAALRPG